MALAAEDIIAHPALLGLVQRQSRALFAVYEANPRLASVFGSQQRWLMAHASLALHFRRNPADPRSGLTAARFFAVIEEHGVASRNAGDAFINEMLNYGIGHRVPGAGDGRTRPIEPAQLTVDAARYWVMTHLATLDRLDGDCRLETFHAAPASLEAIQPLIADGLLSSAAVREPEETFALFIWVNNGGIVMDFLVTGIEDAAPGMERIAAGVVSVTQMAASLKLSRTHLARKLRQAEEMGGIGWEGKRGRSAMWMSRGFLREYLHVQAVKLALIDAAFDAGLRH